MRCPNCQTELKADAKLCQKCGLRLDGSLRLQHEREDSPVEPSQDHLDIDNVETQDALSLPSYSPIGLPPLTPGTLIAERYQITLLIRTDDTGQDYDVLDTWASHRCWACKSDWDDNDGFCRRCGAARRSDHLLMREQVITADRQTALETEHAEFVIYEDRLYSVEGEVQPALLAPLNPVSAETPVTAVQEFLDLIEVAQPAVAQPAVEPPPPPPAPPIPAQRSSAWEEDSGADTIYVPVPRRSVTMPLDPHEQNEAPTIEAAIFTDELLFSLPAVPRVLVGLASDRGRARQRKPNEDTAIAMVLTHVGEDPPPPLTLCVVADGLGGHEGGQRAGRLGARVIATHILQTIWIPALEGTSPRIFDPITLGDALRGAILEANMRLIAINELEGGEMGCTVTALIAQGDAACVANVGDSRTYLFDGEALQRVTTDHSLVARLVAARMLTPDEVYTHPQRSQIYRSLGDETDLQVDLFPRRLRVGESFILCSDGLWELVRDTQIRQIVRDGRAQGAQELADQLMRTANENGGDDNVSVIVAQVVP